MLSEEFHEALESNIHLLIDVKQAVSQYIDHTCIAPNTLFISPAVRMGTRVFSPCGLRVIRVKEIPNAPFLVAYIHMDKWLI